MPKLENMREMKSRLLGVFVAIVTPFKGVENNGRYEMNLHKIDWQALGNLIDWLIGEKIAGIVIGGCTGESFTLTHAEQKKLFTFVVNRVKKRVLVIAGSGSNSTEEATKLTWHAAKVGVDCAMLICPYANKPTIEGIKHHYSMVSNSVNLPIMLYNVPGRVGINIDPPTVAWLYDNVPNIIAIKEASGNLGQVDQILQLCDITVLSGDDALTLPLMTIGATGVISVAANIVPAKMFTLYHHLEENTFQLALECHQTLLPLFKALFSETNPMPVKAALARMGLIQNCLRPPLVPMSEKGGKELFRIMRQLKIKVPR